MRLRLRPTESSFHSLFTAAADNLVQGAALLAELIGADPQARPDIASKLRDCEHVGDEATHSILRQLNQTFVTPFDREDIYRLASRLDDCMDLMEEASDAVVLYGLDGLPAELSSQVDVLQRAAEMTAQAMPRLRSMKGLSEYWIEVNRLENEADKIYRRLIARLFNGSYDALTVLKLKEVVDLLEAAADAFENVADTVESIAVKES